MPEKIIIYGLECELPDEPINIGMGNNKFVRTEIPKSFKSLEYDAEDRPIYTEEQTEFINQEIERCTNGYWFLNNGKPTYLTGDNYYYLQYWVLENGVRPEYRDADRIFFYFFQECWNDPSIIGIVRGKKRREAATSIGSCLSVKIATFDKNQNCGTVSMSDDYAKKVFSTMIVNGFFNLPEFLRPRLDNSGTNKTSLHFIETPKRGRNKGANIEGLNSIINFESTTLNAYDSTRQSFLMVDEAGKWDKIDITRYFEVAKECVREGAMKVGMLYLPTTVNPPSKGGSNFQILWDGSNQFDYGRETSTGMVKYFRPAWEGMAGFIDEYGHSVVEPPNEETAQYLINKQLQEREKKKRIPESALRKGAKKFILDEYSKLKTDEQKSDFKRKFPTCEADMWDFGNTYSPFNLTNINRREQYLKDNPVPLRKGVLTFVKKEIIGSNGDNIIDFNVEFLDDENGNWLIYELPKNPNNFEIDWDKKICRPLNTLEYGGGADTFRSDKTEHLGSNGSIVIGSKLDPSKADGQDGGIICATYLYRPKLAEFFWEEILMASMYWGCTISVENDATSEYKLYFSNRLKNALDMNCLPLLGRRPDAAIDPNRTIPKNITVTNSSDPFVFAKQIELAQKYFERYSHKIYHPEILIQAKNFNPDKRTPFDLLMGFMMCLLNLTGQSKARSTDYKGEGGKMIPTYQINNEILRNTTLQY